MVNTIYLLSFVETPRKFIIAVVNLGYIVMLRARMFRSLIIRTGIKERNIRARNITI